MKSILGPCILACSLLAVACGPILAETSSGDFNVTLKCSADAYPPADTVFATWTNDTDSTVVAGNHPPYEIYDAESGETLCMSGIPWEYHLPPRSWALLSWDQRDCDGRFVPPGRYIMRIWFVFNDMLPGYMVEDRFEILDPASAPDGAPVQRSTWGRLRSVFR
jgi:hypothetical protein